MYKISKETLQIYRANNYQSNPQNAIKTYEDGLAFIKKRGFIFFWPIRGVEMPSLWVAAAGDRPVADKHDDPGHISWGWKDDMLRKRACYYGKILRGKATLISWEFLPYFYSLSENFGDPEEDYQERYREGRLTYEAKSIYEAILENGPLDTIALRKKVRMTSDSSESRFAKALVDLQKWFLLAPVDVTESGGWRYAFAYDIPARFIPDLVEQTRFISEQTARSKILVSYLNSVGAAMPQQIARLFGWSQQVTNMAISETESKNLIRSDIVVEGEKAGWVAGYFVGDLPTFQV